MKKLFTTIILFAAPFICVEILNNFFTMDQLVDVGFSNLTESTLMILAFISAVLFLALVFTRTVSKEDAAKWIAQSLTLVAYTGAFIGGLLGVALSKLAIEVDEPLLNHITARVVLALLVSLLPALILWSIKDAG